MLKFSRVNKCVFVSGTMNNTNEKKSDESSCWEKRTRLEYLLIAALISIVILMGYSTLPKIEPENFDEVCLSSDCMHTASDFLKRLDLTIDPCEDFYNFVCGNALKSPDYDQKIFMPLKMVTERVNRQIKHLIESPIQEDDHGAFKIQKRLYQSCTDENEVAYNTLEKLRTFVFQAGDWPIYVDNFWNMKVFDWKEAVYKLRQFGFNEDIFIPIRINRNRSNWKENIIQITTPKKMAALSPVEWNVSKVFMVEIAAAYGAKKEKAYGEFESVLKFQKSLMMIIDNSREQYTRTTIKELSKNFTFIPNWLEYVNKILSPVVRVGENEPIVLTAGNYLREFKKLLLVTPISCKVVQLSLHKTELLGAEKLTLEGFRLIQLLLVLANYIMWKFIEHHISELPERFVNLQANFMAKQPNYLDDGSRHEFCLKAAQQRMKYLLEATYINKYFPPERQEIVQNIMTNIKDTFLESIKEIEWMDEETKSFAIGKINFTTFHLGAHEDLTNLSLLYSALGYDALVELEHNINSSNYLELTMQLSYQEGNIYYSQLRHPIRESNDTLQFYEFSTQANVFKIQNLIVIPAAILQKEIFNENNPNYLNYGSIGSILSHELTHGLIGSGNDYYKYHWSDSALAAYTRKVECFLNQTLQSQQFQGAINFEESVCDNVGVQVAYDAYNKWAADNKEIILPGLDYTANQLYWISFGSFYCIKVNGKVDDYAFHNSNSLAMWRINSAVSNNENFANDFNCSTESNMNPGYKCKIL